MHQTTTRRPNGFAPEHELLRLFRGNWRTRVQLFPQGVDSSSEAADAICEYRLIEGGLWSTCRLSPASPGDLYEAFAVYGYDPLVQKYVAFWIDSTQTRIHRLSGTYHEEARTLTLTNDGPTSGKSPAGMKHVYKFESDDRVSILIYEGDLEAPHLRARITSVRTDSQAAVQRNTELGEDPARNQSIAWQTPRTRSALGWPEPSPAHQILSRCAGSWDADVVSYWGPSPTQTRGRETNVTMSDGLWLLRQVRNPYAFGCFEGSGILGYDPDARIYVGAWVDCTNPYRVCWEGRFSEEEQILHLVGRGVDPFSLTTVEEREDIHFVSENVHTTTLFRSPEGGEIITCLKASCTRIKTEKGESGSVEHRQRLLG